MSKRRSDQGGGTLIRGADGVLYFIPDDRLSAFRVSEETTKRVHEVLDTQDDMRILTGLPASMVQERLGLLDSAYATVVCVNSHAVRGILEQ